MLFRENTDLFNEYFIKCSESIKQSLGTFKKFILSGVPQVTSLRPLLCM